MYGFYRQAAFLKSEQILEMKDLISIQSHTVSHRKLTELKKDDLEMELNDSKLKIEEIAKQPVTVLAYPFGVCNKEVVDATRKYYNFAVTNESGIYKYGGSHYEIKRVYIPRNLTLSGFEQKIQNI